MKFSELKWKVLVFSDKVYFSGMNGLVKSPDEVQWFDTYDEAAERARDCVFLNLRGVTQVRIISDAFGEA